MGVPLAIPRGARSDDIHGDQLRPDAKSSTNAGSCTKPARLSTEGGASYGRLANCSTNWLYPLVKRGGMHRLYMVSLFQSVPGWIGRAVVGFNHRLNVCAQLDAKVKFTLVVFEIVMIGDFIVLAVVQLSRHGRRHTVHDQPVRSPGIGFQPLLTGATVVTLAYRFDAITMYAEEERRRLTSRRRSSSAAYRWWYLPGQRYVAHRYSRDRLRFQMTTTTAA